MTRTSVEILAEWQQCLEVMWNTPPNEAHFAASKRIEELVQPLQDAIEREKAEDDARAVEAKLAKEAAAATLAKQSGPDVPKLVYQLQIASWAVIRAIGVDGLRSAIEKQVTAFEIDASFG